MPWRSFYKALLKRKRLSRATTPTAVTRKADLKMAFSPTKQVYNDRRAEAPQDLVADVRDAMSRHGDFAPAPEDYADASRVFEF